MITLRARTLVVLGTVVSLCRVASAQSATAPTSPESAPSEPNDEVCRRARLYVTPSLFIMSGSPWTTDAGGTMSTSGENTFHRIAAGALLRPCERLRHVAARVGATGVVHTNVSGFGVEAELDYGAGSRFEGGLRIGVELGLSSHIISAGPRVHVFETAFFGVDAYTARDASYTSRGVMFGFGLEGRAGRWASIAEAAVAAIMLGVVLAGGGPD
ncbi:MAG: hypothetical protein HOV81_19585 [Kofleriaceae bacterium]|nr:hypothetical protein [Kofleriaceae bacterium]